jgi:hypothetical protein
LKNKKQNTHFNLGGLLIAVLMLLAFGSKEVHYLVHHQHVEIKICDDTTHNEHHFHDQDYIHDDCALCDFTFSIFELNVAQPFELLAFNVNIFCSTFSYPSFFSHKISPFALLRGPPNVL